ncbi:MAG TPA: type II CAAX endopeptidase family protein [Rhizomicrobium sp.]|nr:type II CAAX endopeptidase family protein [Rhizomicrobium sp.]
MTASRRALILVGLIPTLLITFAPIGLWGQAHLGVGPLAGRELPYWALVVVLLLYVVLVERRPLASIGFRMPGIVDLLLAIAAGVLIVVAMSLAFLFLFPALHLKGNTAMIATILKTPFWYRFWLVTRAAVSEELLFRAYPIERIQELSGSRWIAALVSVVAFTYAHLAGWGAAQLIPVAFGAVVLAALYLWRRNLWANMLAHWLADGAGFLLPH